MLRGMDFLHKSFLRKPKVFKQPRENVYSTGGNVYILRPQTVKNFLGADLWWERNFTGRCCVIEVLRVVLANCESGLGTAPTFVAHNS